MIISAIRASALILAMGVGVFVAPGLGTGQTAMAQSPARLAPSFGPDRHPTSEELLAAPGEKSLLLAGLLQAAVPPLPLGYAHAGDIRRGVWPSVLMIAGTTLGFVETIEVLDWTNDDGGSESLMRIGFVTAGVGYVWGIVGAVRTASDHNERIGAFGPSVAVVPRESGASLLIRFPVGREP